MSHAILISSNETVNALYEVNLKAYVATNVTVKSTLDEAMELLIHDPQVEAIIFFKDSEEQAKAFPSFAQKVRDKALKTPIIILGELEKKVPNAIEIASKYNIKGLLQAMAKILEITAQEMASQKVSPYFPVPIGLISPIEPVHCDVYLREQKENFKYEYHKILDQGDVLGGKQLELRQAGNNYLYIESPKRLHFINKASALVITELDRDDLTGDERLELTQQGMGLIAEELMENETMSEQVAIVSKTCMDSIQQVVKSVSKFQNLLKMLMQNPSDYCYKHSVLSSFVAGHIIDNISWGTQEQKEKVGFALFFHDIFLVPLYKKYPGVVTEEDLLFTDAVTDEEKEIVLNHAKMAGNLVKDYPQMPMGADMIITQHHGMTSGQGFANKFKDDISPLSKIIIVAEDIATNALVQSKKHKKIIFNSENICAFLEGKYRNHTYKRIIEAFRAAKL